MHEDNEGFLYPAADASLCIHCGLCEKVCPVINQNEKREPLAAFAARNRSKDVRKQSSSGGVFTALAEKVLSQHGVVFGARFDEHWEVVHDWADTAEKLNAFRGAKYTQSKIGNSFLQAEKFLKEGRIVLFSGTPCQIAGLKGFLRKPYENLLLVDVICHGVPSPGVWREYLQAEMRKRTGSTDTTAIRSLSFRDKSTGWKTYSFTYVADTNKPNLQRISMLSSVNPFMRGFLADMYLRPSCSACPAKSLKSGSDLTIGDYWGLEMAHPELDDDKGTNAVITSTEKGKMWLEGIADVVELTPSTYGNILRCNPSLIHSSQTKFRRKAFFALRPLPVSTRVRLIIFISSRFGIQ